MSEPRTLYEWVRKYRSSDLKVKEPPTYSSIARLPGSRKENTLASSRRQVDALRKRQFKG